MTSKAVLALTLMLAALAPPAAREDAGPAPREWTARWISVPGASPFEYGVYHFRRELELKDRPSRFVVHVSGDNRYQLFVNGTRVAWGPARGDLYHWRYETVDLAPHLRPGNNVLAAAVWNFAQHAPQAQVTFETGFLLQGDGEAERAADTGKAWKCTASAAYRPLPVEPKELLWQYYVAGPGERVEGARYSWGWELPEFDDSGWAQAAEGERGASREARDAHSRYMLVPRNIPMMEERPERLARVRQAEGVRPPEAFPREQAPFQVPPRTTARLLLDQNVLTTAYPELVVSGGAGAVVTVGYAENLFVPGKMDKGHRDEVEGKQFRGYRDEFVADGGAKRLYRPLWWRTYRYLQLTVQTRDEPLTVEDLRGVATGYPFERRARFEAGSEELDRMREVGWRTARLCAHETYMDCPYYEQLQYAGDTRIQALVSLYESGDDRLMRNAISQIDDSRTAEGLTQSRAPTRLQQYIPPYSLWWVGMVRDYWWYREDEAFVRGMLPGVRAVLSFFAGRQRLDGSLGPLPWWNYVDAVEAWPNGVPKAGPKGGVAPIDLQLLLAYEWAVELETALGSKALAAEYRQAADRLRGAIQALYWDAGRGLYADTEGGAVFSQQTNSLAVIARMVEGDAARALMVKTLSDGSLVQASIYFRYYLHDAMRVAGEGDRYVDMLEPWRKMLALGLTTWPEYLDPTRSDCHAWGASPNVELLRTVLGVDSAAPGFRRVRIAPHPGRLTKLSGSVPHPKGEVVVSLARDGARLEAEVTLPEGVEGELVWRGQRRPLAPGRSKLSL
jgi:hypothetical protein